MPKCLCVTSPVTYDRRQLSDSMARITGLCAKSSCSFEEAETPVCTSFYSQGEPFKLCYSNVQRGHQNSLELQPSHLICTLLLGLKVRVSFLFFSLPLPKWPQLPMYIVQAISKVSFASTSLPGTVLANASLLGLISRSLQPDCYTRISSSILHSRFVSFRARRCIAAQSMQSH